MFTYCDSALESMKVVPMEYLLRFSGKSTCSVELKINCICSCNFQSVPECNISGIESIKECFERNGKDRNASHCTTEDNTCMQLYIRHTLISFPDSSVGWHANRMATHSGTLLLVMSASLAASGGWQLEV